MLKLCNFPGIETQNNLSYKTAGPLVSCIFNWVFIASGFLSKKWVPGERGGFLTLPHSTISPFAVPRRYLQAVIRG